MLGYDRKSSCRAKEGVVELATVTDIDHQVLVKGFVGSAWCLVYESTTLMFLVQSILLSAELRQSVKETWNFMGRQFNFCSVK